MHGPEFRSVFLLNLLERRRDDLGFDQPVVLDLFPQDLSSSLTEKRFLGIVLYFLDELMEISGSKRSILCC